jgi:4a-hydroxytetrahydrobiopterin dehydratase
MPRLLGDAEIRLRLEGLDGWTRRGGYISKAYDFQTFMQGIEFLNSVARVAEGVDHHPDISVRYTRVRFSIRTHSSKGITARDFELAKAIDGIPMKQEGRSGPLEDL